MEYVKLGRTGLEVSRVCLGCMSFGTRDARPWMIGEEAGRKVVRRALDLGINFFDTTNAYSDSTSEEIAGGARAVSGWQPTASAGSSTTRPRKRTAGSPSPSPPSPRAWRAAAHPSIGYGNSYCTGRQVFGSLSRPSA